jgi:hypothetical protein
VIVFAPEGEGPPSRGCLFGLFNLLRSCSSRTSVAPYDGVSKADRIPSNVVDSAADGHRVTGTKRRDVLGSTDRYTAKPGVSRKFAG